MNNQTRDRSQDRAAAIRARLGEPALASAWPFIAFATIVVLLGVNFVAVRFSNAELPPFWGAALRFIIAAAILFLIVRARRLPLPEGRGLAGAVLFGVLVFGALYGLMYWALLEVSSGMAAVMFATSPLLTIFMGVPLGLERLTGRGLLGGGLVILGLGLVFQEQLRADVPLLPLLAVVLAVVFGSLSGIVVKRFPRSHPISLNAVAMGVGAALLLLASAVSGESRALPALPATWAALSWLIMSASVSFILMVWLLSKWSASAVSYGTVLTPLVTVLVASWLIGEGITLMFVLGGGLALAGTYVGALKAGREQLAASPPAPGKAPEQASEAGIA